LAQPHPLALLLMASTILGMFDHRDGPSGGQRPVGPSQPEMMESLFGVEILETSALLAVIGALQDDDLLRARIRRELTRRSHPLPDWLAHLTSADPYRTAELVHVLRDGDNVMVGVRLHDGHQLTAVVYIDHNMGTVVKDAFVLDQPIVSVLTRFKEIAADDPDSTIDDIPAADARARVTQAITLGAITVPPFETDTWPACRPLVEWIVRSLPTGGQGYETPDWDGRQLQTIADRFLASTFGKGFRDRDSVDLVDLVLQFGSGWGLADPLRWSPTAVEIILGDWVPRRVIGPAGQLSKMPGVLRAFIRFAHHERGLRPALTTQTLAAVDEHEAEYQRTIRSPRPGGPAEMMAALSAVAGGLGTGDSWELGIIADLATTVGGDRALDSLTADPLPDEPFDQSGIARDIVPAVREVLAVSDEATVALFDVEFRTAARRLLALVARGNPEIFRRGSRADWTAAAIGWIVAKANRLFDQGKGIQVKDYMAHFGLKGSPSQRALPMLRAGGFSPDTGWVNLGSPAFLTSERRSAIMAQRDRLRERLEG
jgi:hypothetical protein